MKTVARIVIGFLHDFAAGCWAATLLAVWHLDRARSNYPAALLQGLEEQFFYAGLAAIALILATGAGRTFTYVNLVYGGDGEGVRRRMLIAKHLLLFVLFGGGTWWEYVTVFR